MATCAAGLEELVAEEIRGFAASGVTVYPGAVTWQDRTVASAYRACLWSRFASRILLSLASFPAPDPDAVYRGASTVCWADHFTPEETFAVSCSLSGSRLTHSHYAALRVKDAVADWFQNMERQRPSVNTRRPDIRLHLHVEGDQATLSLDLSGESLHRRGYRLAGGEAPLKETLAAGLAALAGVKNGMSSDQAIVDPMCGSGTLLIEAALIIGDSAPGLQRKSFGFQKWRRHSKATWESLVDEALQKEQEGLKRDWPQLMGSDADPAMVRAARKNVATAGLEDRIHIVEQELARIRAPAPGGLVLTNPPYGERLLEKRTVSCLYRCLGRILRQRFSGWRLAMFSCNPDLAAMPGFRWASHHRLHNGPLSCRLFQVTIPEPEDRVPWPWKLATEADYPEGRDLANRLRKNCERLFRWAKSHDITCLRIYDADLPEYNFAVDLYGPWIHVQEYAPPASVDRKKAEARLQTGLRVLRIVLNASRGRIFIKTRRRQKGGQQYQKQGEHGRLREVREGTARFLVNLSDYLDTGLFLDHRKTRRMLARLGEGKRFLNLFGYTGTATVSAALGGARSTTTVDLSASYLDWAKANLALNGLGGPRHRLIRADCLSWLETCRESYDLIFVDPPTFSRSRHRGLRFQVQDDHETLLEQCMQHLSREGVLIFSNNYRRFKISAELVDRFHVREITHRTRPVDFRRSRHTHRCWRIRHRNGDRS